jgi:hypothetical protein
MTSLEGGLSILSCRRKTDIAISVGAGHCALSNNLCIRKTARPTREYQGPQLRARRSSAQRYGELPGAGAVTSALHYPIMQREERLSDSRNRQAAGFSYLAARAGNRRARMNPPPASPPRPPGIRHSPLWAHSTKEMRIAPVAGAGAT